MPHVQVKVIEGAFTPEEKQQMITKVTEAMVEVEGEALRPVTSVIVEDIRSGEWGIGGRTLTAQDVKDMRAG
jgi:4-oxalocrotonate tautomerase